MKYVHRTQAQNKECPNPWQLGEHCSFGASFVFEAGFLNGLELAKKTI